MALNVNGTHKNNNRTLLAKNMHALQSCSCDYVLPCLKYFMLRRYLRTQCPSFIFLLTHLKIIIIVKFITCLLHHLGEKKNQLTICYGMNQNGYHHLLSALSSSEQTFLYLSTKFHHYHWSIRYHLDKREIRKSVNECRCY